jgi:hypothetical protein
MRDIPRLPSEPGTRRERTVKQQQQARQPAPAVGAPPPSPAAAAAEGSPWTRRNTAPGPRTTRGDVAPSSPSLRCLRGSKSGCSSLRRGRSSPHTRCLLIAPQSTSRKS